MSSLKTKSEEETMPIKNRNFAIEDEIHRRLKILAAERGQTIGSTIAHLLDLADCVADKGVLVFHENGAEVELNISEHIKGDF
jgi:hypothetical protein